jgi:hypothetical protein
MNTAPPGQIRHLSGRHELPQDARPQRHPAPLLLLLLLLLLPQRRPDQGRPSRRQPKTVCVALVGTSASPTACASPNPTTRSRHESRTAPCRCPPGHARRPRGLRGLRPHRPHRRRPDHPRLTQSGSRWRPSPHPPEVTSMPQTDESVVLSELSPPAAPGGARPPGAHPREPAVSPRLSVPRYVSR